MNKVIRDEHRWTFEHISPSEHAFLEKAIIWMKKHGYKHIGLWSVAGPEEFAELTDLVGTSPEDGYLKFFHQLEGYQDFLNES